MSAVVMDDALVDFLSALASTPTWAGLTMRLFTNAHTPANTDTISDYAEASFAGYGPVTLSGWGPAVLAAHQATMTAATATFTYTGESTTTVQGYYVTDAAATRLYWAEQDPDGPVTLSATSNSYAVPPSFFESSD